MQRARGVEHKGQEREAGFQHTMTSGFYFYFRRTSGWVVGGERIKEAGNKYGSATMSRPDQWSCFFGKKTLKK